MESECPNCGNINFSDCELVTCSFCGVEYNLDDDIIEDDEDNFEPEIENLTDDQIIISMLYPGRAEY